MLTKKKQLLREFPNRDSCPASQEADVEMTALGINLNQPLTDQLAKHHKGLKSRAWDDGTYNSRTTAADEDDDNSASMRSPENLKTDFPGKNSDAPLAATTTNTSPASLSKWTEVSRIEPQGMERKSNQNKRECVTKGLDTYSSSSSTSGYGKSHNGVAAAAASGNNAKPYRRFDDIYRPNGKEFDEKRSSPSVENSKRTDKIKDSAVSSIKGTSGRNQSICSNLLPGSVPERTSTLSALPGYPLCSLPLQLLPPMPNAGALNHPSLPQLLLQQHAAAQLQQLHLLQQQQQQPRATLPTGSLLSSYSLHADNLLTHQLEMLWQQKYPNRAVPPGWMLYQYQDELLRDPRIPNQKEMPASRDKDDQSIERERMLRELVEKEKLDWERQEREIAERERMELERHQKEKKERERWEQEKHDLERQEHSRALDRERREWERHQQEARRDQQQQQQQHLQLEMHQRRELIVDESASSASDAVNQHFQESFLRLASQKGEGTRMEVANPSYAYMAGLRNIYRDRVKIERHQNPLCNKMSEESKYAKMLFTGDSNKVQNMSTLQRETSQHQNPRQESSQHEISRRENNIKHENSASSKSSAVPPHFVPGVGSQLKPENLNFNLYGYQPTPKDRLYNSPGRLPGHGFKDDVSPKVETDGPKYDRHKAFVPLKNGSAETKHDTKQTSVIIEPHSQCDIYHHGSITLGTAGSGLHRGPEGPPSFGTGVRQSHSLGSTAGSSHCTISQTGSKSTIGSPSSGSAVKDQKQGRNIASSPRPVPAASATMYNLDPVVRDALAPWLPGSKEHYEQWREMAAGMIPQKAAQNLSHQKLTSYSTQSIPSAPGSVVSGHHLVSLTTCSLIQQGLVPNPLYISPGISSTGSSGALVQPTSSALHSSSRGHLLAPIPGTEDGDRSLEDFNLSVKRRQKKELNGIGMKKKSKLDLDTTRFPVPKKKKVPTATLR